MRMGKTSSGVLRGRKWPTKMDTLGGLASSSRRSTVQAVLSTRVQDLPLARLA